MKKEIISGVIVALLTAFILWAAGLIKVKVSEAQLDLLAKNLSTEPALANKLAEQFAINFSTGGLKIQRLSQAPEDKAAANGFLFLNTTEGVKGRIYGLTEDGKEDSLRQGTVADGASALIPIRRGQRYRLDCEKPREIKLFLISLDLQTTEKAHP